MTKLRFYPLETSYKIVESTPIIELYGRLESGEKVVLIDKKFEPYLWVITTKKSDDLEKSLSKIKVNKDNSEIKFTRFETHKKTYLGKEVSAVKAFTQIPSHIPLIRDEAAKHGIVLEADILFARRYLIDNKIYPLLLYDIEAKQIEDKYKCPAFELESIKESEGEIEKQKIIAVDIETYNDEGNMPNAEDDPIIMLALVGEKLNKVITWKKFETNHKYIEFVENEQELLQRFAQIIDKEDPDIITGYFTEGFDLPFIKKRAEKFRIKLRLGINNTEIQIGKGQNATSDITGITHFDVLNFIRRVARFSLETDLYDLNSVSKEILNESKVEVEIEKLFEAWNKGGKDLERFCEYNLQDSVLTYKLAEKLLPNMLEITKIVGLSVTDASRLSFSQIVEWFLLRQAPRFNELAPNRPGYTEVKKRMQNRFEGAFVFEPKKGLYKDIAVFDFRSLYPTIISAHNISPDTINAECDEKDREMSPDGDDYICTKKKGFIATVIDDIIKRRMRVKEIIKKSENEQTLKARAEALKIVANSVYGYLGFANARWYSFECAKITTAFGRAHIREVIEKAKEKKFTVLYSDTDSIFLSVEGRTKEDALKFVEIINKNLPGIMELEYEGFYPSGIFVSTKGSDKGAKKKYALLNESGQLTIKGFETVRRNLSSIAKETQARVLDIALKEHDAEKAYKYVKKIIQDTKDKKIPNEKMIITTQLTKDVKSYDAIGPHVAIAQRMIDQGKKVKGGSFIKYIITDKGDKIRDKARMPEEIKEGEYDSNYYITHQIIPVVERILDVLGYQQDQLEGKEQSKLDGFFS